MQAVQARLELSVSDFTPLKLTALQRDLSGGTKTKRQKAWMTLPNPYECLSRRNPAPVPPERQPALTASAETTGRHSTAFSKTVTTTKHTQTSSMPSSSWNVRDKRRQVMVESFFVKRIKSFPIRMEPLQTGGTILSHSSPQ